MLFGCELSGGWIKWGFLSAHSLSPPATPHFPFPATQVSQRASVLKESWPVFPL